MIKKTERFPLTPTLENLLGLYRSKRAFDPAFYLEAKINLLSRYFEKTKLRAAVLGVSGGIDSAIALAILNVFYKKERSFLKRLVPICLPFFNCLGATGQVKAVDGAKKIINFLNLDQIILDLNETHGFLYEQIANGFNFKKTPWSQGQLVSNLRTPVFYQIANHLNEEGYPCAVFGTINRDEGSYTGFFGKASDAMVDIQLISDLHKSEVKKLASFLNIPQDLIDAQPTGNTYDSNTDELSFGFSYDFLELYTYYLNLAEYEKTLFLQRLDKYSYFTFSAYEKLLLERHTHNQHKYFVKPQGLHFDVYSKSVAGGWLDDVEEKKTINLSLFQNFFVLDDLFFKQYWNKSTIFPQSHTICPYVFQIENALSLSETEGFLKIFNEQKPSYVGNDGYPTDEGKQLRATTYSPHLASLFSERLVSFFEHYLYDDGYQPIDGGKNTIWRMKGFSPFFRFIMYEPGGELIGHYDEGYEDGREKTLFSVLFYLTTQPQQAGGETVILLDKDRNTPLSERCFQDDEDIPAHDILHAVLPSAGHALVLPHRIKHGVTKNLATNKRVVIRADIIYERLGPCYSSSQENNKPYQNTMPEDKFYLAYYLHTLSKERLRTAGYIENAIVSHDEKKQTQWSILPLLKLCEECGDLQTEKKELVVLLSTGGFYPIHQGHFLMMSKARQALELEGKKVIGGFFSPSHQDYIKSKFYVKNYSQREHIDLLIQSVANHPWLDIWLWEYLENKEPINFTDVIIRLECELAKHLKTTLPIKVAYVFGGDNVSFSYAFLERGIGICLSRPGAEKIFNQVRNDPLFLGKNNIYFLNEGTLAFASEAIRKKNTFSEKNRCKILHLREDELFYQLWSEKKPLEELIKKKNQFLGQFVHVLKTTYSRDTNEFSIQIKSSQQQALEIKKLLSDKMILSLDPCYIAEFNLGVSRYFRFGLPEIKLGFSARPEEGTLAQQLLYLPKQPYCLVDDDCFTGKTIEFVKKILHKEHIVEEFYVSTTGQAKNEISEIIDLRDFIVGSYYGGLVVLLPNKKIARVPYIYPFVLPSLRYHCPADANLNFSLEIWKFNREFFSGCLEDLLIKHCDKPFVNLATYLGFSTDCSLREFCDFYVKQFNRLEQ
ncbi:NAD+ synthetase [Legionella santicrucis]|uniref:NH(3)-dependent NAD(+) synthetase n=1 Tax=Legionella santicrucis TaxID=45074 RepID=A0A0W0YB16_9GAMM|nr:NAD(+) synthase [Legionella santicrucis]KTD53763.1 NAD+ synthetase [Legionella santicrucis]